ncbi:aquaporin [Gyrodon lividus]|nr:aquaporin [Gyrodon lividus]
MSNMEKLQSDSLNSHIHHGVPVTNAVPFDECSHCTQYPNRWSRIRHSLREPFAEFLGTLIFVAFGTGVNCQVFLSQDPNIETVPRGSFLSVNFGWASGLAFGVLAAGGISGGHINPAITIALAVFRGFPWKKVPIYIFAQLLGAICGGAITYANYFHSINIVEGGVGVRTISGSGDLLANYAAGFLTPVSCFFSEFLSSAMLMMGVLAVTDGRNGPPPPGLVPLSLFIILLGIGAGMGLNTGYGCNPARDLGPRIVTAMVGYGRAVFDYQNQYWIWCPILGPVLVS